MEGSEKGMETKEVDTLQRKHPFDNLPKEELIKKCKHFLMLAQKAKQAKDDANEEISRLKEELAKYEGAPEAKPKEPSRQVDTTSMQEMIDTLTEQKLSLVIEMDKVLKQSASIERQLDQVKQDERKARQQVTQLTSHVQELETGLESAHRQIKRLTRENDDLLQQLDTVELELRSLRDKGIERSESIKVKQKITAVENEMAILQEELDRVTEENKKKNEQMKQLHDQFSQEKLAYEEQFKRRQISWEERICELQDQFKKEKSVFEQSLVQEKKTLEESLKQENLSFQNKLSEIKEQFLAEKQQMELNAKQHVLSLCEQFANDKLALEEKHKQYVKNMEEQKTNELKSIEEAYIQKLQNNEETFIKEKQSYAENMKQQLLNCEKHCKQELKLRDEKFAQKLKQCEETFCEEIHLIEEKFLEEKKALEEEITKLRDKLVQDRQFWEQKYNVGIADWEKKLEQEKMAMVEKLRKERHTFEEKLHKEKSILEEKYQKEVERISEARNNVKDANLEIEKLTREIQNLFQEKEQFATHVLNLKETLKYTNAEKDAYFQVKERLKHDNESLLDQLKTIMSEKDRVVSGIENVKQNNAELNQLIQSLGSERESFVKDISKLNMEKKRLIERLDSIEGDTSAVIAENDYLKSELQNLKCLLEKVTAEKILISEDNTCLKSEKQKLNELLETVSVEKIVISEENSCLKAEKEKLEDALNSERSERKAVLNENSCLKVEKEKLNIDLSTLRMECENLHSEIRNAKDLIYNKLQHSLSKTMMFNGPDAKAKGNEESGLVAVSETESTIDVTLPDILTTLCDTIEKHSTIRTSNDSSFNVSDYNGSKEITEPDSQEGKNSIPSHIYSSDNSSIENGIMVDNEKNKDEIHRLHSELQHLNNIISNLESHGEKLHVENEKLREEIRVMSLTYSLEFQPEVDISLTELEVYQINTETLGKLENAVGKEETERLINLFLIAKQQSEEIRKLKNELASINPQCQSDNTASNQDILSDFKSCQENLKNKITFICLLEEKLCDFLGRKFSFEDTDDCLAILQEELSQRKIILDQNSEDTLEMQQLRAIMESKSKEYEKLRSELHFIQDVSKDKERELSVLKERLENIEEKHRIEVCSLREKFSVGEELLNLMKDEGILPEGVNEENALNNKENIKKFICLLKDQLAEKTSLLENLVQECEASTSVARELSTEVKSLKQEREQFEADIAKYKQKLEINNEELISLKQSFVDLKCQSENCISELQKSLNESQNECSTYKKLVEEKSNDTDSSKAQLVQAIARSDEIMVEMKKVQDDLNNTNEMLLIKTRETEQFQETVNILEKKNSDLISDLRVLQDDYDCLKQQFEEKHKAVLTLETELQASQKIVEDLQKDLHLSQENYQQKFKEHEAISAELNSFKTLAASDFNSIKATHDSAIQKVKALEEELIEADNKFKYQKEELDYKTKLLEEEKNAKEKMNEGLSKISSDSQQLHRHYTELKNQAASLKATLSEHLALEAATLLATIERLAQSQAVESMGILHDMNEMNQALKLRGETISKLQEVVGDLEQRLHETRNCLGSTQEELKVTKIALDEKTERIKALEEENSQHQEETAQMRTRIAEFERDASADVAPSEVTSNSTISKAEEQARLKDLEDTFEERYTKLRTVAVRLKKRVAELTAHQSQLEAERSKLTTEKQELQACVTQMSAQAKNLQTLQHEYDKLQDTLEQQRNEIVKIKKNQDTTQAEMTKLKKELEQCIEEKTTKIKLLETCNAEKLALEASRKDLLSQLKTLRKQTDSVNNQLREKEASVLQLQEEIHNLQQQLTEEEKNHKTTKQALETSIQESKKTSLLTLEMDDYERRLSQLSEQLEKEKAQSLQLQSHLDTEREIESGLQQQIHLLEQRVVAEETRSREAKDQINIIRQRLSETESSVNEKEAALQETQKCAESLREELEVLQLQLASTAADKLKIEETSYKQHTLLTEKISLLEDELRQTKSEREKLNSELEDIQSEFENYKVRAASVLRQKARPDEMSMQSEDGAHEEIAQLRKANEILTVKLEELSTQISSLEQELLSVRQDRAQAVEQVQELLSTVAALQQQVEQLQEKSRETTLQHTEALRNQKLHNETLVQSYKQQIANLEERLTSETTALKFQLKNTEEKLLRTQKSTSEALENSLKTEENTFLPVKSASMEISLLEREECEGSENVESLSPQNVNRDRKKEPVPLERLLESPIDGDVLQANETPPPQVQVSPQEALLEAQSQLSSAEARGRHLASLLSEAERELALSQQQAKLLKDELRRSQRSVEREQHAHNLEYLKNVLLKFVTLQGGDERSRLVPVLNTILKLSPEETNQLLAVSKGTAEAPGGARGWGSYFPIWPNL